MFRIGNADAVMVRRPTLDDLTQARAEVEATLPDGWRTHTSHFDQWDHFRAWLSSRHLLLEGAESL